MNSRTSRLVSVVALLILSACAGPGAMISSPDVRLTGIELTNADFRRQKFLLGFHVSNPNPFPLPVKEITYRIRLGEQQFASGRTQGNFTVPSNGDSSFAISVEVDLLKTTTNLSGFLPGSTRDNLEYELSGSLSVDLPFAKPLNFSHSDSIDVLSAGL